MKTYTVFAYAVPSGGHLVGTLQAGDATEAGVVLRDRLGLLPAEFEIVAVAEGAVTFACVDGSRLALAPYAAEQLNP